jgi:DNA-binding IclR family transcriptional regulator
MNRMARQSESDIEESPQALGEDPEDASRDFITSVARAFSILRCFKRGEKALGNKEIAQRTGLPKSSVARIAYTLTKLGYLEFLPAEEKYSLGIGVLALGQNYLAGLDVREVARPLMQELAEYTQATVALAARDGDTMVFLEMCHGNQLFRLRMEVGQRVPRGTTALGRAGHVATPEPERSKALASYLSKVKKTEWAKIREGLDQALKDYEKYGFCFSLGDWNRNVFAVGVPMTSDDGKKILAFSCFGPVHEMTRARLITDIGPRLVELRDRVKNALGGSF